MSRPFKTTHRGRDIFKWNVPRSGTKYALILEWALAAQWWGYKWFEEFCELDGSDQAFLVAVYRAKHQIDAVEAYQMSRKK